MQAELMKLLKVVAAFMPLLLLSCASDERSWKEAQTQDSVSAYEDYLAQYPKGEFADSARTKIKELMTVVIRGRFMARDESPIPGVEFMVGSCHEGKCVLDLSADASTLHAVTDGAGTFEILMDRTFLESLGNRFCLWATVSEDVKERHNLPHIRQYSQTRFGELAVDIHGPASGIIIAKDEGRLKYELNYRRLKMTFEKTKAGVEVSTPIQDETVVFKLGPDERTINVEIVGVT